MKGDIKADINNGVENTPKKVKSGVEYLKPGGEAPTERLVRSGNIPAPAPQVSHRQGPISKRIAPDAQSAEPNQQSKWVPKYCPYCGGPLTGLFSCDDLGTSHSSNFDEGNDNIEEEAIALSELPSLNTPQHKPTQPNVRPAKTAVKEDVGKVHLGGDDGDENNQQGPDAPARSDQSKSRDLSIQQTEIEDKEKEGRHDR
jgi:hypothetical protein